MLNCKITKVPSAVCDTSVSGILKLAVANWSENYNFSASAEGCAIDTIDLAQEHFLELPTYFAFAPQFLTLYAAHADVCICTCCLFRPHSFACSI